MKHVKKDNGYIRVFVCISTLQPFNYDHAGALAHMCECIVDVCKRTCVDL